MVVQELFTKLGFTVDPSGIKKGQDTLSGFKSFIGKLALGAGIAMVGRMAIQSAAQMESMNAQFTTMLGSQEKAAEFMANINKFAAETPFETSDIASAAQTLMGFGVEADKVMSTVSMLGDVAGVNSQRFGSLALVFGQIQSTGRLMGGDLLQLINAGFNPLKVIADKTGKSMGELKKDMENGQISAEMVTEAFRTATSKGGLFYENMKNQSQTFTGVWSTMMDNIRMSLTKMVMPLMPTIKKVLVAVGQIDFSPIVNKFEGIIAGVGDVSAFVKVLADNAVTLVANLVELLPVLISIANAAMKILQPISDVLSTLIEIPGAVEAIGIAIAISFGGAQLAKLAPFIGAFRNMGALLTGVAGSAGTVGTALTTVAGEAGGLTTALETVGGSGVLGKLDGVRGALNNISTAAKGSIYLLAAVAVWEAKKAIDGVIQERRDHKALMKTQKEQDNYGKLQMRIAQRKKQAEEDGDAEEVQRLQHKLDENRRIWTGQTKEAYYGARGLDEFGNKLQEQTANAVSSSSKLVNVFNNLNMDIKTNGGDGKTGLTASMVADLANQAVKAQFNVQLKKVLVGV